MLPLGLDRGVQGSAVHPHPFFGLAPSVKAFFLISFADVKSKASSFLCLYHACLSGKELGTPA